MFRHDWEVERGDLPDDYEIDEEIIESDYDEEPEDDESAKYPRIHVQLVGENGNALNVIGLVKEGLKRGGVSKDEIAAFQAEAMSGDYYKVLSTAMRWVTVL